MNIIADSELFVKRSFFTAASACADLRMKQGPRGERGPWLPQHGRITRLTAPLSAFFHAPDRNERGMVD